MDDMAEKLLSMMKVHNFDLVNNEKFYEWTITARDGMGWNIPDQVLDDDLVWAPAWNDEMHKFFGFPPTKQGTKDLDPKLVPLDSVETMRKAFGIIFWYRESLGLEAAVMYRRELDMMWIDPSLYMMCSEQTQDLANIYVDQYMMGYCCNSDYINYPPMIVDLIEWADKNYAK